MVTLGACISVMFHCLFGPRVLPCFMAGICSDSCVFDLASSLTRLVSQTTPCNAGFDLSRTIPSNLGR